MNYQKQYPTKISWKNSPDTSTPLNATNLNKMDNALWYMDNALYILSNAIGGGSSIRGGIIDNVGGNMFRTHIHQRTGESLVADELLLLRSEVSGTGTSINVYTDQSSAQGVEFLDLDGESTSVTLTDESIMFLLMVDEYSAKVLAVINANDSGLAGLGIGKMTSYTDEVVDTDIDLHRAPMIGDRILLYCNSAVSNPSSIKTYDNGAAVSSSVDMIQPLNYVKGWNILEYKDQIGERWVLKQSIKALPYTAGIGIGINDTTITNTNPQLGTDSAYKKFDSSISSGNLGFINGYAKNLVLDFRVDATPDENNGYTFTLQSGTTSIINKAGVLKDRDGNLFMRDIYSGMILYCESNVSGTGTQADPVVVTVLSIDNWYVEVGRKANTTIGAKSTAEGEYNTVSGAYGHADGYGNTASGNSASAHGIASTASGDCSVADGSYTTASGANSSAHGDSTIASGIDSSASGEGTIAGYLHQTAMGKFNANKSGNLLEVGNGSDDDARSNALEVTADGHVLDGNGNDLASVAALEQSASGNPIVVNAQGIDAKALSVELEPIQDLHGYDHPWVGGAGLNKCNPDAVALVTSDTGTQRYGLVFDTAGTYTLSASVNLASGELDIRKFSDDTYTWVGALVTANAHNTFTETIESGEKLILFGPLSMDLNAVKSALADAKVMVESGSTAHTYEPYSNICPISGRTEARVDTTGSNLIDPSAIQSGAIDASGNEVSASGFSRTGYTPVNDAIFALIGSTAVGYTVRVHGYNASKQWVEQIDYFTSGAMDKTYTVPSGIAYIRISYPTNGANFILSQGHYVTIQLGQTVYGGTLNVTTGVLTVDKEITTFNGDEDWSNMIVGTNFHQFAITLTNAKDMLAPISNRFGLMNISERGSKTGIVSYSDKTLRVCFKDDDILISSSSAFQAWLASNNLQVCYELATPTTIQLTPSMLKLLEGYNYITADGDMQLVYIPESVLPTPPTADGNYKLRCTVSNGVPSFSWVSDT